jgi:hypothetical protein
MTPEPFVSAERAAEFLGIRRRRLLALARKGIAGAYAIDARAQRKTWVFRLSELVAAIVKSVIANSTEMCDPASGSPR